MENWIENFEDWFNEKKLILRNDYRDYTQDTKRDETQKLNFREWALKIYGELFLSEKINNKKMENKIKLIDEFFAPYKDYSGDEMISIPKGKLEWWLETLTDLDMDDDLNDVIRGIQGYLAPEEPEVQPVDDKAVGAIDELTSDDEDTTLIKKFEGE